MVTKIGNWVKDIIKRITTFLNQVQTGIYFDSIFISLIVIIAFFMFEPGLNSSWGIIDDHELLVYSPASHPLGFSEIIPTLLTKTEINPDSTTPRFRPAYFSLRLIETRIWSTKSPFPWYLFRIIIFIFFITTIFLFFKRINGRLIGVLLAFLVATFSFWNGIFSRLGPAETYAILGLSLFLIGTLILIKKRNSNFSWLLIMLGTIIAIGSKENMVVFLVPEVYLFVIFLRKPIKKNIFPFTMVAISILWTLWIFVTVILRIKANGSDIYENSVGLLDRLSILLSFVSQNILLSVLIGVLLIIGIVGVICIKDKNLRPRYLNLIFCSLGIIILISSQLLFYSGSIWGRYNFPYALYLPFIISFAANFLQNLPLFNKQYFYHFSSLVIGIVMILFFIHPSNILLIRKIAFEYDQKTHQFEMTLHDIKYYLSTNLSSSIVVYGNKPEDDYERILSVIRYIRNDGFLNDIFIYSDPPADYETTYSKLNVALEKELLQWSTNGKTEEGIKPIKEYYMRPNNCLLISFSEKHPESIKCNSVINIQ